MGDGKRLCLLPVLPRVTTAQERVARGASWSCLPPDSMHASCTCCLAKSSSLGSVQPTSRHTHRQSLHLELSTVTPSITSIFFVLLKCPVVELWSGESMVRRPGGLVGWCQIPRRGRNTATHPPSAPLEPPWAEISLLISSPIPQLPGLDCWGLCNQCVLSHSVGAAP